MRGPMWDLGCVAALGAFKELGVDVVEGETTQKWRRSCSRAVAFDRRLARSIAIADAAWRL